VSRWPVVAFGEILTPNRRPYLLGDDEDANLVGMRLYALGPFHRELKPAGQIRKKSHFVIREGDVIYNKLFAWKGTFGIVPPELDGMFVSDKFPTYALDDTRVDPGYLRWYFRNPMIWEQARRLSTGSAALSKLTLNPPRFLDLTMPLPPLEEQRRVVEKLDQLAAKTQRMGRLSSIIASEAVALRRVELECRFAEPSAARVRLEDACEAVIDNLHTTPRYTGDDFACVRSQDVGWGSINYGTALRTDETEFLQRTRRAEPRAGDIVYVREGDIGRCAVVDGSHRFSLGQRVMMLRPDADTVNSDYLMFQLMSPAVLDEQVLASQMGTTSRHVNVKVLRSVMVVIPPLHRQMEVVASLRRLAGLQAVSERLRSHVRVEAHVLSASALGTAFGAEKRR